MANSALVVRNGQLVEIPANEVVPGDILQLEDGTVIPTDGRIVSEDCLLQVDQSAITGESLAVDKEVVTLVTLLLLLRLVKPL